MNETAWQTVGRLVRARRERLHLKQEDLRLYAGPGVSTVGKVERGAQTSFPLRTQHQLENALGWKRGAIEEIIDAINAGEEGWFTHPGLRDDFEDDLVNGNIPDLSTPRQRDRALRAADLTDDELLSELTYRFKRYAADVASSPNEELNAITRFITTDPKRLDAWLEYKARPDMGITGDYRAVLGDALGKLSEDSDTTDLPLAAHEEGDIDQEAQEQNE